MASFHSDGRTSARSVALAILLIFFFVAAFAIVGTVERRSLNPDTDCRWDEIRLADGTCR